MKRTANTTESRESRKTEQLLLRLYSLLRGAALLFPITRLTAFLWDVMLSAVSYDKKFKKRRSRLRAELASIFQQELECARVC